MSTVESRLEIDLRTTEERLEIDFPGGRSVGRVDELAVADKNVTSIVLDKK